MLCFSVWCKQYVWFLASECIFEKWFTAFSSAMEFTDEEKIWLQRVSAEVRIRIFLFFCIYFIFVDYSIKNNNNNNKNSLKVKKRNKNSCLVHYATRWQYRLVQS